MVRKMTFQQVLITKYWKKTSKLICTHFKIADKNIFVKFHKNLRLKENIYNIKMCCKCQWGVQQYLIH